jgi:rhodanese-related sulfurtransferase
MSTELPLEIDVHCVKALVDGGEEFLLLDCREPEEFNFARIPNSKLIPMQQIPGRVQELEAMRDKRIVVHCHHGGRSLRVTNWLRQQGFTQAQNMAGGIDDWSVQIDPSVPRY